MMRRWIGIGLTWILSSNAWCPSAAWAQLPESPEALLDSLAKAFNSKDDSLYASLLASDFQFQPGCPPPDEGPIDRERELTLIRKVFASFSKVDADLSIQETYEIDEEILLLMRFKLLAIDSAGSGFKLDISNTLVLIHTTEGWQIGSWNEGGYFADSADCSPSFWYDFRMNLGDISSAVKEMNWGALKQLMR